MPPESRTFIEEARRAQIIECAIDVLAEHGYLHTTLAKIAKRAKISTGVISYHFGGKDQLIQAVVADVAKLATDLMIPRILAQPTATEGLRAYIESNLEFMRLHRKPLLALVQIVTHAVGEDTRPGPYDRQADVAITDLEKLLDWGRRSGEFRDFDLRSMAIAIRGAIDAVPGRLLNDPDFDLDLLTGELVTTFTLATRRHP
ncbi:TetR/AcrR family transcriptional regulator [Nonomuraea gerenzanensis]|uniref:Transcriptional regulator, TetR family n=1 Tax=Nonomuraea gerenzanensis TaxID=93944 RepID=A0A1M4E3J1_9ACTN|nr:TetR/AcrR family transcriptional regulator [Nonomuraea gerenzanensis]UBU15648.1 TetR family transcriptional regulator [Nonomuraea gerenzanensis]SBO93418.1 Transcriptional regulator, TetR family [Nonomuraea gerenzanensis]